MKKIGLAGVGLMGHGIAANIIKNGYSMLLLEHSGNQPLDALIAAGAATTPSASLLAGAVDVVILCVTGSPEVEDLLYRQGGLLQGLKPGLIVIDCSTAIPSSTIRIADAVNKAGGFFLDAAMTRTPKEAAEGRLNLIVGGDKALFEACRPIMDCYAENIVLAGPVGSGHRLKLLHNFVSLGFSAVLAEAAACADRAGVDARIFAEVLADGGGAGVVLDRLRPYIESRDGSGFRFTIANAQKDMTYYTTMAREAGAAHTGAEAIRQIYSNAAQSGPAGATVPELIDIFSAGPAPSAG
jgi:3-hydroxyisobutyrate dehydrogenase-like beta-hydroxyacid dehydrogenase